MSLATTENQYRLSKAEESETFKQLETLKATLSEVHTRNHELIEQSTYWNNKYEKLKSEVENVSDFFAKYERRVI